jgi:Bax protein
MSKRPGILRHLGFAATVFFTIGGICGLILGAGLSAIASSPRPNASFEPTFARVGNVEPIGSFNSPAALYGDAVVEASAQLGVVMPPPPGSPVMGEFDAVAKCAYVDLEMERRLAEISDLRAQPTLRSLNAFWKATATQKNDIASGADVPPLFLTRMPADLTESRDISLRKRSFITMMLPHILAVNAELEADRGRITAIRDQFNDPTGPSDQDVVWLFAIFKDYSVQNLDFDKLLARVDAIPPALAIAQAAKESGWGTSRFAQQGNALYGQWTWNPKHRGIVPKERPKGKTYRVRSFDSVLDATRTYAANLNKTRAYGRFRVMRRDIRAQGKSPSGVRLTETMDKYSAIGQRYVRALKSLIAANQLTKLNNAQLAERLPMPVRETDTALIATRN